MGLWVSNHTASPHVDNYRSQRRRADHSQQKRANLGSVVPNTTPPTDPLPPIDSHSPTLPQQLHGQLSLLDYLDGYIPDNSDERFFDTCPNADSEYIE
jgi:hypothetical protein